MERIWKLIISRKGKATSVQQNNNNMESISGKYLQRKMSKKLNIHHTSFTRNTGNISYMHVHNVQQKAIFMYLHAVSVGLQWLQWFVFVYLHMGTVLAEQWSQEKCQL